MFSKSDRKKQEAEWRAEDDLRTYQNYLAICKDPKRLKAVNELAKKRLSESKTIVAEIAEERAEGDD